LTERHICGTPLRALSLLAGLLLTMAALAATACASTVTTTGDGGPGSLRQLVADAAEGETIHVPAGEYVLTSGTPIEFSKNLQLVGEGSGRTVISGGDKTGIFVIRDWTDGSTEAALSGMTLRKGRLRGGLEGSYDPEELNQIGGAAILAIEMQALHLRDVVMTENVMDTSNTPGLAVPGITGGTLDFGGETLTMVDCEVTHNVARATNYNGRYPAQINGGAVEASGGQMLIEGSTIADNLADVSGDTTPNLDYVSTGELFGAGMMIAPVPAPGRHGASRIVDSTISGNVGLAEAGDDGYGNLAQGGGLFVLGGGAVTDELVGVTLAENEVRTENQGTAQGGGLAMVTFLSESSLRVKGSTIAGNSARGGDAPAIAGGDIFAGGNLAFFHGDDEYSGRSMISFADSIVAGGSASRNNGNCAIEPGGSGILSAGFNLDSTSECGLHSFGDENGVDPLLGPLRVTGGHTATMAPASNSPAVDQGASSAPTDGVGLSRRYDNPAIANPAVVSADGSDIGAVELQAPKQAR
jgi:hypothetical protein